MRQRLDPEAQGGVPRQRKKTVLELYLGVISPDFWGTHQAKGKGWLSSKSG